MTIVYVTTGAWGAGTGTPNSAAQVDGNFYDVDQRIVDLNADLAEGKRIDTVTYTSNSMTFHFTDGTTQVIPLPVATLDICRRMDERHAVYARPDGRCRQRLLSGAAKPYDASIAGTVRSQCHRWTASNPLYQLWMPLNDVNYDAAIFVPGSIQRTAGELLFQGIANRTMQLGAGDEGAYARLDVANPVGATNIILSIQKNSNRDRHHHDSPPTRRTGAFNIPAATDFAEGDRYALRVTQSNNAVPSGLSVTLPFMRTDI